MIPLVFSSPDPAARRVSPARVAVVSFLWRLPLEAPFCNVQGAAGTQRSSPSCVGFQRESFSVRPAAVELVTCSDEEPPDRPSPSSPPLQHALLHTKTPTLHTAFSGRPSWPLSPPESLALRILSSTSFSAASVGLRQRRRSWRPRHDATPLLALVPWIRRRSSLRAAAPLPLKPRHSHSGTRMPPAPPPPLELHCSGPPVCPSPRSRRDDASSALSGDYPASSCLRAPLS